MPARVADWTAVWLGNLARTVLTSRRRIAMDNLRRAFGDEKSEPELEAITKEVFITIARTTFELLRLPVLKQQTILDMAAEFEGAEYLKQAADTGKGAVLVTGHIGNWELLGALIYELGYPVDFLIGKQHNPYVQNMLIKIRASTGINLVPVGVGARQVMRLLKDNHFVAMVADQHSASAATRVDFFGRPAATPSGPAAFAVKLKCPILFGYLIRDNNNRCRVVAEPPIYPPDSGDREKDIVDMTQEYTKLLEKAIRKYPGQWMWTHRRWKIDG